MERIETRPIEGCCDAMALPIWECHRRDVAEFHYLKENMNLWCPCCGRFWRGSYDSLEAAKKRVEE